MFFSLVTNLPDRERRVGENTSHLKFEILESRVVPAASLTAELTSAGVLRIEGTEGADFIDVRQIEGVIKVAGISISTPAGVKTTISASSVKSIDISALGGDDSVRLDLGVQEITAPATIRGGDGNDTIFGGAGDDKIYGEGGNDILVGGSGNDYIDAGADSDGSLLSGGIGNDILMGSNGNDVIYGDAGDDTLYGYGGADFLSGGGGKDILLGGTGNNRYQDIFDPNAWAINGTAPEDVQQQNSGTCTVLSALAAAGQTRNLADGISYAGNNIYNVRLYVNGQISYQQVYFDGNWSDYDAQPSRSRVSGSPYGEQTGDFWTLLYQRAVFQKLGYDWNNDAAMASFPGWYNDAAQQMLLGNGTNTTTFDPATIVSQLAAGNVLSAYTNSSTSDNIVAGHAYAVRNVYFNTTTQEWRIQMYNPWGVDGYNTITGANDGVIDISWAALKRNFGGYAVTV